MNRFLRIISILVLVSIICLVFTGCKNNEEGKPVAITNAQQSASDASVAFVEALATGDFETAVMLTEAYSEDGFMFANDIEWYLPRSSFAGIQKLGFETFKSKAEGNEIQDTSRKEGSATYTVTLYDAAADTENPAEKSFVIETLLNDDNMWVVSVPEFYCENFLFRTAGGDTSVYIDGKEVSESLCSNDEAGPTELCKEYTIPYIGKNDVEVRIICENYDYTKTITPNSNNSVSNSVSILKPVDEPEKCFSYVKDTWNAMCAKYLIGEKASCVQDYIADDASYDLCNTVWDGFEEIHVGDSSQGGFKNENYNLSVCKASSKGNVYWLSDTHIMCYFDYELTWYYTFGKSNQSTHQNSSVVLSVENGVYKFYDFPDTGLFFEANNYSNEW